MSFSIPQQIEKDIIAGRATYRTFQTGNGGQSILQVPTNSYAVIFGYDFSPAGGGFKTITTGITLQNAPIINNLTARFYETQQISFFTGSDFYPFIHHVNCVSTMTPLITDTSSPDSSRVLQVAFLEEIDNSPISCQVYITSTNDVTITHGLILKSLPASSNAMPITNRTPQALTYGGSPQLMNTQTNYGPGATPQQFMQPSPKDYADFAFGLLPNNPDNQAFATPDTTNGLRDSTELQGTFIGFTSEAAAAYYLCIHYALYSAAIPDQRG